MIPLVPIAAAAGVGLAARHFGNDHRSRQSVPQQDARLGSSSGPSDYGGTPMTPEYVRQLQAANTPLRLGSGNTGQTLGLNTGTGGGGATGNPADLAMFDQALQQYQDSLGQLGDQRSIGLENIQNAYQQQLNRLLQGRATAQGRRDDTMLQTEQDNVRTRSNIDASVGRNVNSLQRLLGARGAGTSSAAQMAAPLAAANIGTQQQGDVADAYARNMAGINQSWGDYEDEWNNSRTDLGQQRYQQRNQVNQGIAQQRQSLLQNIGQVQAQRAAAQGMNAQQALAAGQGYLDQARGLSGQITQLGRQFGQNIRAQDPSYQSPDLAEYDYRRFEGPNIQGGAGANAGRYSNLIPGLRRQDEERRRR